MEPLTRPWGSVWASVFGSFSGRPALWGHYMALRQRSDIYHVLWRV